MCQKCSGSVSSDEPDDNDDNDSPLKIQCRHKRDRRSKIKARWTEQPCPVSLARRVLEEMCSSAVAASNRAVVAAAAAATMDNGYGASGLAEKAHARAE